eukprot:SAG11_NODE_169_length_13635_cov_13.307993_5_plen_72_part_00
MATLRDEGQGGQSVWMRLVVYHVRSIGVSHAAKNEDTIRVAVDKSLRIGVWSRTKPYNLKMKPSKRHGVRA